MPRLRKGELDVVGKNQRARFKELVDVIERIMDGTLSRSRAQSLAKTKLDEFAMWIEVAIHEESDARRELK